MGQQEFSPTMMPRKTSILLAAAAGLAAGAVAALWLNIAEAVSPPTVQAPPPPALAAGR
jgi:hypothetical protein